MNIGPSVYLFGTMIILCILAMIFWDHSDKDWNRFNWTLWGMGITKCFCHHCNGQCGKQEKKDYKKTHLFALHDKISLCRIKKRKYRKARQVSETYK